MSGEGYAKFTHAYPPGPTWCPTRSRPSLTQLEWRRSRVLRRGESSGSPAYQGTGLRDLVRAGQRGAHGSGACRSAGSRPLGHGTRGYEGTSRSRQDARATMKAKLAIDPM